METIELTIVFCPQTGQISLNGPMGNKLMCYGMLEMAKDLVRSYDPAKQSQILVPAMPLNGHR